VKHFAIVAALVLHVVVQILVPALLLVLPAEMKCAAHIQLSDESKQTQYP
jgi:hypothetical protein